MEIHVSEQAVVFLWTVLGGILIGLVYDVFRVFRKLINTPSWVVFLCDIVFWVICSIVNFIIMLEKNSGQVRWFLFAGTVIGAIIYFSFLSMVFQKLFIGLLRMIIRIGLLFKKIFVFLSKPFKIVFVKIRKRKAKISVVRKTLKRRYKSKLKMLKRC